MSKRELITKHREAILALAAKHGATEVRVFGSVARGDDDDRSDIDLFVRRVPGTDPFLIFDFQESLQSLLACEVDVLADQPLMRPDLRAEIVREAVPL
jgi:hypothetical protein